MTHHNNRLSRDSIKGLLLENGIRPTFQRLEIAETLLAQPQHMCADQLLGKVNKNEALVSKATVYNTLNLLVEKGLVYPVLVDSGKVFYDSNTHAHHHLYNEDTGELMDIQPHEMLVENIPELPEGMVKTGIDVVIRVRNKAASG